MTMLGPTGGMVRSPGAELTIPAGALTATVEITVKEALEEPAEEGTVTKTYELGPSGTTFAQDVVVTLDLAPEAQLGASNKVDFLLMSDDGAQEEVLPADIVGGRLVTRIRHFSRGRGIVRVNQARCRKAMCRRPPELRNASPGCDCLQLGNQGNNPIQTWETGYLCPTPNYPCAWGAYGKVPKDERSPACEGFDRFGIKHTGGYANCDGTEELRFWCPIFLYEEDYPQSVAHIRHAGAAGDIFTVDRPGSDERRKQALKGCATCGDMKQDRDEVPQAVFAEGRGKSSIWYIDESDNVGSGACIGNQLKGNPDGTKIQLFILSDSASRPPLSDFHGRVCKRLKNEDEILPPDVPPANPIMCLKGPTVEVDPDEP